jgi:hypothetical protein
MQFVEVALRGHLTELELAQSLQGIDARLREGRARGNGIGAIFDCSAMTGYDPEARAHFMEWHSRHRRWVAKVAVVTTRPLWHGIVLAMGLASRVSMRAFDTRDEALAWMEE